MRRLLMSAGLTALVIGCGPPESTEMDAVQRGAYLVQVTGCARCHSPEGGPLLSGHPADARVPAAPELTVDGWFSATTGTAWAGPYGVGFAANLTSDEATGIGAWSQQAFVATLKTGEHMGVGREILPAMPWQVYQHLSEDDLEAIFTYLRTAPAVSNEVPLPVLKSPEP
jgi:mono/diheme cytochrome c family protein